MVFKDDDEDEKHPSPKRSHFPANEAATKEAEYVAAIEASKEMIWLQRFMGDWVRSMIWAHYTVIVKVSFILQRTQHFIPRLNTYSSSTISYDQCWKMES